MVEVCEGVPSAMGHFTKACVQLLQLFGTEDSATSKECVASD